MLITKRYAFNLRNLLGDTPELELYAGPIPESADAPTMYQVKKVVRRYQKQRRLPREGMKTVRVFRWVALNNPLIAHGKMSWDEAQNAYAGELKVIQAGQPTFGRLYRFGGVTVCQIDVTCNPASPGDTIKLNVAP